MWRWVRPCVVGLLVLAWTGSSPARRPPVDRQAMREAMRASLESGENVASSASYAHFLKARLAHHQGEHRRSIDELRLALVTDEGNPYLLTRLAEQYARLGDLARAERTLRQVIDGAPSYAPGQLLMGRVLAESGKASRARIHLRRAIKLDPALADAYLMLTQLELQTRRKDAAVATVEQMSRALPKDARGFRILAGAFAEGGDEATAERMLRRAVEINPRDLHAWQFLARVCEASGRHDDAEKAFAQALIRDPDNTELLFNAGRVALRGGGPERARAWFDRALSLTDDPELAVRVAFAWFSADEGEQAVAVLERARGRRTSEPRLTFYAALIYERLGKYLKAADAYAAVPQGAELHAEAQVRRATALSRAGEHGRAKEAFARLRTGEPKLDTELQWARAQEREGALSAAEDTLRALLRQGPEPQVYDALFRNLFRQDRAPEAITLLQGAVRAQPDQEALRFSLAVALELAGRIDESIALMRQVLQRSPQNASALNFIGYVLADHGRSLDEAERLILRALELKPDTGAFLDSLGWVHYRKGNWGRAVELLEKALVLEPEEAVIADHLGDAYLRVDRPADAARAWRRALQLLERADGPIEAPGLGDLVRKKLQRLPAGG
jgi:tetratricopeptide (TPR) repeat protein